MNTKFKWFFFVLYKRMKRESIKLKFEKVVKPDSIWVVVTFNFQRTPNFIFEGWESELWMRSINPIWGLKFEKSFKLEGEICFAGNLTLNLWWLLNHLYFEMVIITTRANIFQFFIPLECPSTDWYWTQLERIENGKKIFIGIEIISQFKENLWTSPKHQHCKRKESDLRIVIKFLAKNWMHFYRLKKVLS